ncbi:MAG: enoyl-CoA hydratase-related protein [Bacteroidota bacterium]
MAYKNLQVEEREGVVYLMLNRPKALNALNQELMSELRSFFESDYANRQDIHGVIMYGSGDRAFAAGADIKEFVGMAQAGKGQEFAESGQQIFFSIEHFHRPVVAVVSGFALGGGCELCMACHMRIATESARFGQPEVNLGIIPGFGGTQRLSQLVGKGKSLELILTGNMIDAQEAHRIGLVNHVLVDRDAALAKADELLQTIGTKGPIAIEQSIVTINAHYSDPGSGFQVEADSFGKTTRSEDFIEGASAFVEKRKANFVGK